MGRTRVLLADDHALLLGAFEKLLGDEFEIVGAVGDGRALVSAAQATRPDVIVLDIGMPLLNGLDAARIVKRQLEHVKLVFLTMYEDPALAAEAFRAGASGYLLKRSAASELLEAVRQVTRGKSYITPLIAGELVGTLLQEHASPAPPELTSRQREVLQLLVEGRSMKEVAALLNVSARTVAFHKYEAMKLLNLKTTAELIRYAVRHHIV